MDTSIDTPFDRTAAQITCSTSDGSARIVLSGDIDAALRDQAGEAMAYVVVQNLPVVIDVGAVTFIDSSGLAFLVQLHRLCGESDLTHELLDPSENLLDLLDVLGMNGQFVVTRSPAQDRLGA